MVVSEVDFVRLEGSVQSLAESILRFEKSVDKMAEKAETGNLKRDEAIGDLSRKIEVNAAAVTDLPNKIQILETWMIESKAKSALIRALPGLCSGMIGAAAALLAFIAYISASGASPL